MLAMAGCIYAPANHNRYEPIQEENNFVCWKRFDIIPDNTAFEIRIIKIAIEQLLKEVFQDHEIFGNVFDGIIINLKNTQLEVNGKLFKLNGQVSISKEKAINEILYEKKCQDSYYRGLWLDARNPAIHGFLAGEIIFFNKNDIVICTPLGTDGLYMGWAFAEGDSYFTRFGYEKQDYLNIKFK